MATLSEDIVGGRGLGVGGDSGLGIIALLALLGGKGFGGDRDRDCVDTATHQASLNALQGSFDTNSILAKLATIEAAVPYNEAQMQLALAGSTASLTAQANSNVLAVINGQHLSQLENCQSFAGVARDIAAVDTNVDRQSTAIQVAIRDDGEKTRALITSNTIAELNQRLTVAQQEALELRNNGARERDRHGVEITMTNNQNQNQLQFQAQAQVLSTLSHGVIDAIQSIRATNSAINIGGTQLASPTNTNSNVRA